MKQLACEMCGGTELVKQDGAFVCQNCGIKYSVEEAKKMMLESTVDVQGTVKVDNTVSVEKYLLNARHAKQKEDWKETGKCYNMVEQNDPTNIEAIFYSAYAQVKLALLEAETTVKRRSVINILLKSVSIIDDYYDNTNEEHQKLLFEIMDKLYELLRGRIVPTTYLSDYVIKNGYGDVVDRTQVIEQDHTATVPMINEVIVAYMDSLANIIVEYSPEPVKKLFMENVLRLSIFSEIHEKIAPHIDGYKTPKQAIVEIAKQVKIDAETTNESISTQINALGKTICPMFMEGEEFGHFIADWSSIKWEVEKELKKMHPNPKVFETKTAGGCYIATAVYGSYDCPQVWTLRRYRDNILAKTWYGRTFIHTYYAISPTLVKWVGNTTWFKKMWQGKLDRKVADLQEQGIESTPYEDKNW